MKIGILGLGSIGGRHANNLVALGHEVVGYDPMKGGPTREEALQSDAIVIASPTKQHYQDLVDATATKKPIFCEKPLVRTSKEMAIDVSNVWVGYNLRFAHVVQQAKRLITEGQIGNPIWAKATVGQYSNKEAYLRDGVTLNWSHEIDLVLHLLGPGKCTSAWIDPSDTMAEIGIYHTETGAQSMVHMDYLTKPEIRATTIVGDKGHITIDLVQRWGCLTHANGRQEIKQFHDSWNENYYDEIGAFVGAAEKPDLPWYLATGKDGLAVMEICLAAKKKAGLQK